jgi:glucose-1-phosphatase
VHISPAIKNIIFDLGGVILDLDVDKTYHQFAQLSGRPVAQLKAEAARLPFFNEYEQGSISDDNFRGELKGFLRATTSDQQVDKAWNAMLGVLPLARVDLLKKISGKFRIFLLSNTNHIHLQCFTKIAEDTLGSSSWNDLFERTYYSHLIKMRKPDAAIYSHVLNENNLRADQTLFLDDNLSNLQGAASIGIQTFHVTHPDLIFSLFHEIQS